MDFEKRMSQQASIESRMCQTITSESRQTSHMVTMEARRASQIDRAVRASMSEGGTLDSFVHTLEDNLSFTRLCRRAIVGTSVIVIAGVGTVMALMMWVATLNDDTAQGPIESKAPAPYWLLVFLLLGGMLVMSALLGEVFRHEQIVWRLRGSLEYTTIMIINLKTGTRYMYCKRQKAAKDEFPVEKLDRELHQLKVEAGLAGWTEEMLEEQLNYVHDAFHAKCEASETFRAIPTGHSTAVVKKTTKKLVFMVKNTFAAMPVLLAVTSVVFAIATVGIGAVGMFLTIGIADMPNPDDNPLWTESSWQIINVIFTLVAIWKGPQRFTLLYQWLLRKYEYVTCDGAVRSLMMPGVLLEHWQVGVITLLRCTNIVCQYIVCFFMWAWLPRCLQEEREQKIDCTSRPAWGVPIFLVLGMGTDIASNIVMSNYIATCPYLKWPTSRDDGPILTMEVLGMETVAPPLTEPPPLMNTESLKSRVDVPNSPKRTKTAWVEETC